MQDQMYQDDSFQYELSCAHRHPDNVVGEACKLCGQPVPPNEVKSNGSQVEGSESG